MSVTNEQKRGFLEKYSKERRALLREDSAVGNGDTVNVISNLEQRFVSVSEEQKREFVEKHRTRTLSRSTERATAKDLSIFKSYLKTKSVKDEIQNIPPEKLNELLAEFVLVVRKENGEQYGPSSLKSFVNSVNRYLREKGYVHDITYSKHFAGTKAALATRSMVFIHSFIYLFVYL